MQRRWWLFVVGFVLVGALLVLVGSRRPAPATAPPLVVVPATPSPVAAPSSALRFGGRQPVQRAVVGPAPTARPCLRGRIVDGATAEPLVGAQVVFASTRGALQTTAGPGGAFELSMEEPGVVEIAEVSAPGYVPYRPAWGTSPLRATLAASQCAADLVLSLAKRVRFDGLVRALDGAPVGGAHVTIGTLDEPPETALTTNADGTFAFEARDGATLLVKHPAFEPKAVTVDFRVGVSGKVVVLLTPLRADAGADRATLTGRVIDERDAGVPGALVMATQRFDESSRLEGQTESAADGTFSLPVEGPGPWRVSASLESVTSRPTSTQGEPVVLRLLQGSELRGVVRDVTGAAVQAFSVMLSRREGPVELADEQVRHFVDAQGAFSWRGLPSGVPLVVAVAAVGSASSDTAEVTLEPGAAANVSFTLRRGGTVTGVVVDRSSKAPLVGARVSFEDRSHGGMVALPAARTGADGAFVLRNVKPGRRSLFVVADGHHARLLTIDVPDENGAGPFTIDLGSLEKDEEPRIELVGIGAVLEAKGDALVIKEAMPGAGAALAGLGPGDGILSIDGAPAKTLGFAGAVERIRGEEGSTLELEVRRVGGNVQRLTVTRRRVAK